MRSYVLFIIAGCAYRIFSDKNYRPINCLPYYIRPLHPAVVDAQCYD